MQQHLTAAEIAQRARFDLAYRRSRSPVMLAIERRVCGCDFGGTSWTTRAEAKRIVGLLGLGPGHRLLEVGAGSGWPGLRLAETSGCDVVLVDLPLEGLRIAAERAASERLSGVCWVSVADAAHLPFRADSFDSVSHSDVLCCLQEKRRVLEACRRVIRETGRMVFSVISVASGLSPADYRRAVDAGPEFIETEGDYASLLRLTGWAIVDCRDLSADFADSYRRQIDADEAEKSALRDLIGESERVERLSGWHRKLAAVEAGLLRRELFVTRPETD